MNDKSRKTEKELSFSIVMETDNLTIRGESILIESLKSFERQTLHPSKANEFLIIDSVNTSPDLLQRMQAEFPYIEIKLAEDVGYYRSKMDALPFCSGDLIAFVDSDCIYSDHWIESMINTLQDNPEIQILCGESSYQGNSPYLAAILLSWNFPPYSLRKEIYKTSGYGANNVVFRKEFIEKHPIPTDLDLTRGNCTLHAFQLTKMGYTIWKNPIARNSHPIVQPHNYLRFYYKSGFKGMAIRSQLLDNINIFNLFELFLRTNARFLARQVVRIPHLANQIGWKIIFLPISILINIGGSLAFLFGTVKYIFQPKDIRIDLEGANLETTI